MTATSPVLISWVAVNNDPYERERGKTAYRLVDGEPVAGPMLSILFDEESPFSGAFRDVVLLHRCFDGAKDKREQRAVEETSQVLREHESRLRLHIEPWRGDDPTCGCHTLAILEAA